MTQTAERDPASFRDPSGHVFHWQERVFRTVYPRAVEDLDFVIRSGLLEKLEQRGWITPWTKADDALCLRLRRDGAVTGDWALLIEHPRLPFVSYPYEWTFPQLRSAALRHLEIQQLAFAHGVALSDSSAFNMQWLGSRPVHIDLLSLRRYRPGEIWAGYDQFCRQFLFPLLVEAHVGVPFQPLYRGDIDGIGAAAVAKLIPWRAKYLSLRGYLHVALRARLHARIKAHVPGQGRDRKSSLGERQYLGLLEDLRQWITGLKRKRRSATYWSEYAARNSYSAPAEQEKLAFVCDFAAGQRPAMVWDLGGNTGAYSQAALRSGAGSAVVFDSDLDALELAFERATAGDLPLVPIVMDLASPSPACGWRQRERKGLRERASADAVLALALLHHLAIGRNIPLEDAVDWIVGLAPAGVIEFVPKSDPMVVRMLAHREDIFPAYTQEAFRQVLGARAEITREACVGGRLLVAFRRRR